MTYQKDNTWEIETPTVAEDCSFCDNAPTRKFVLTPMVMSTIRALCKEVKREWQILLVGKETEDGIYVHDYIITEQETSEASVKNLGDVDKAFTKKHKLVGTCHSHGNMGVFFSRTDDVCTNFSMLKNHIVTNNKGEFKAISRVVLPCGLVKFADALVHMKVPDVVAKDIKGLENIKERTCIATPYAGSYYNDEERFMPKDNNSPISYHSGSTENITWKRGNKRNHAFKYGQDDDLTGGGYGGF